MAVTAVYVLIVGYELSRGIADRGWSGIRLGDVLIGIPIYTLMFIDWILIPIGVVVGLLTPVLVRKKTRREAVLYGLITGLVIGLIFAWFGAYDFAGGTALPNDSPAKWWGRFWGEFGSALLPAVGYTSIWTIGFALMKAGDVKTLPASNQPQLSAES